MQSAVRGKQTRDVLAAKQEAHSRPELALTPTELARTPNAELEDILEMDHNGGNSGGNSCSPAPFDPVTPDPGGMGARVDPQLGPREAEQATEVEKVCPTGISPTVGRAVAKTVTRSTPFWEHRQESPAGGKKTVARDAPPEAEVPANPIPFHPITIPHPSVLTLLTSYC